VVSLVMVVFFVVDWMMVRFLEAMHHCSGSKVLHRPLLLSELDLLRSSLVLQLRLILGFRSGLGTLTPLSSECLTRLSLELCLTVLPLGLLSFTLIHRSVCVY
jgi:hypothetical protein